MSWWLHGESLTQHTVDVTSSGQQHCVLYPHWPLYAAACSLQLAGQCPEWCWSAARAGPVMSSGKVRQQVYNRNLERRAYRGVGQRVSLGVHSLSHFGSQADHYPQRIQMRKSLACATSTNSVCRPVSIVSSCLGLLIGTRP